MPENFVNDLPEDIPRFPAALNLEWYIDRSQDNLKALCKLMGVRGLGKLTSLCGIEADLPNMSRMAADMDFEKQPGEYRKILKLTSALYCSEHFWSICEEKGLEFDKVEKLLRAHNYLAQAAETRGQVSKIQ